MNKHIIKIISGLRYSLEGLRFLLKDHSWQIELAAIIPATLVVLFIDKSLIEKLFLFGSYFVILIVEALNAAIEAAIDHSSLELHPLAKKGKDIASAAVFLAIINAVVVWVAILT